MNVKIKSLNPLIRIIIVQTIFFSCSPKFSLNTIEISSYNMVDSIAGDSAVSAEILPYKTELEKTMNEVLNFSETAMVKGEPEGLLGNFVADLILKKANNYYQKFDTNKIQICLLNKGGLRTSLPQGEITRGKIFELMPFENEISVLTISGKKANELFEYLAKTGGAPVSGIKMGIENEKPVNILIGEEKFDSTKTYKVVTSDYLASGGDKYIFFSEAIKREDLGVKIRDAIIEFCIEEKQKGNSLISNLDGRIYYVR